MFVMVWSGLRVQWPSESEHWSRSWQEIGQSEAASGALWPMRWQRISLTPGTSERILVQSRHGWVESERTVMRTLVIHWDVLGPLLGLCHCHSPPVFTWPASWQTDTPSSGSSSSDNQTRMKVLRYLKTKQKYSKNFWSWRRGRYHKTACIYQPIGQCQCPAASKVSDTEEVALIFIITPAHDQSYRSCGEQRLGKNRHYYMTSTRTDLKWSTRELLLNIKIAIKFPEFSTFY